MQIYFISFGFIISLIDGLEGKFGIDNDLYFMNYQTQKNILCINYGCKATQYLFLQYFLHFSLWLRHNEHNIINN